MKILQIIGNLNIGGAEKLLLDMIPRMNEFENVQVDLLVFNGTEHPFLKKLKESNSCSVYSLGSSSIYNPLNIFKIIKYLKGYDIVHVHLFPAQYYVVFAKILSFSKIKLILTEHNMSNGRQNVFLLNQLDKVLYKSYKKTICLTQLMFDKMLNYTKLDKNYFHVIANGIKVANFINVQSLKKEEIHQKLTKEDKIIIQVSRFHPYKDQYTLIKSLKYLPNEYKLLLVGSGDENEINKCENLVKELKLENQVFFLGKKTDEIPSLLKSVEIVVLSTKHEGFPLTALEGMASGKPFIGSGISELKEIVEGYGILFKQGNAKDLADKIIELITNKEKYQDVSNKCVQRAKEYDIDFTIQKHIELYKLIKKCN